MVPKTISHLETEIKLLLSAQNYHHLLSRYHYLVSKTEIQKNYYFDTNTFALRHLRTSVRLRTQSEKTFFTLKRVSALKNESFYKSSKEIEHQIKVTSPIPLGKKLLSVTKDKKVLNILESAINAAHVPQLTCWGTLINKRTYVPLLPGLTLEVDCFTIKKKRFFELEIETPHLEAAKKWIELELPRFNVNVVYVPKSKQARLYEAYS